MNVIALDDPAARDALTVGDKAARLARARAQELPVLPGLVLPISEGATAEAVGKHGKGRAGRAAAYLALAAVELDDEVRGELRRAMRSLGDRVVVRSSTLQEADGRWSGAFASYLDVGPGEIAAAVRGCWASVFSSDAAARAEAFGVAAEDVRVAVLIQPMVDLDGGGTATVFEDGRVVVTGVAGPPGELLGGRRAGTRVEVLPDGTVTGATGPAELPETALAAAAGLARRVAGATGDTTVEWGIHRGRVLLLQARRRSGAAPGTVGAADASRPPFPAVAVRLARLADRFPAPTGEALVLSWALGQPDVPEATAIRTGGPAAALEELRHLAADLRAALWGGTPGTAARRSQGTIRLLLGDDPVGAMSDLQALPPIAPDRAVRLLGLAIGLGERLAADGLLPHPEALWRVTETELERAVHRGERPPVRLGPDRWEPFVFEVTCRTAPLFRGASAAPGTGAGRLHFLRGQERSSPPGPRLVLAAPAPWPRFGPLLWGAAGLVTGTGSVGAHLFEVARSLGVPAVSGVSLENLEEDALVAVDGGSGSVWVAAGGTS